MSVDFDTDNAGFQPSPTNYVGIPSQTENGAVVQFVIKLGLAQDAESANKILLGVVVFNIALTTFLIFKFVL